MNGPDPKTLGAIINEFKETELVKSYLTTELTLICYNRRLATKYY